MSVVAQFGSVSNPTAAKIISPRTGRGLVLADEGTGALLVSAVIMGAGLEAHDAIANRLSPATKPIILFFIIVSILVVTTSYIRACSFCKPQLVSLGMMRIK